SLQRPNAQLPFSSTRREHLSLWIQGKREHWPLLPAERAQGLLMILVPELDRSVITGADEVLVVREPGQIGDRPEVTRVAAATHHVRPYRGQARGQLDLTVGHARERLGRGPREVPGDANRRQPDNQGQDHEQHGHPLHADGRRLALECKAYAARGRKAPVRV